LLFSFLGGKNTKSQSKIIQTQKTFYFYGNLRVIAMVVIGQEKSL
jgi:hypothetical protein